MALEPIEDKTLEQFKIFQAELDGKYNRWEKIVKLSRNITIESKRLIFHLHRINIGSKSEKSKILNEAKEKATVILASWKEVAMELKHTQSLEYLRAFSPGLQEYIEAVAFMYYLEREETLDFDNLYDGLVPIQHIQKGLTFTIENVNVTGGSETLTIPVPIIEYLLGIADLTGEIMRLCINHASKVSSKESKKQVFNMCAFIRVLYEMFVAFSSFVDDSRQRKLMGSKINVMKSSLQKTEDVCYLLEVRGQEFPHHLLGDQSDFLFSTES